MTGPTPPLGTPAYTLHWLHRPTGAPYWMVAHWTGDGWNLMDGERRRRPEELVWWDYVGVTSPPPIPGSAALNTPCRSAERAALDEAVKALRLIALPADEETSLEQMMRYAAFAALDRIGTLVPEAVKS